MAATSFLRMFHLTFHGGITGYYTYRNALKSALKRKTTEAEAYADEDSEEEERKDPFGLDTNPFDPVFEDPKFRLHHHNLWMTSVQRRIRLDQEARIAAFQANTNPEASSNQSSSPNQSIPESSSPPPAKRRRGSSGRRNIDKKVSPPTPRTRKRKVPKAKSRKPPNNSSSGECSRDPAIPSCCSSRVISDNTSAINCNNAATFTAIEEGEVIIEPIIAENTSAAINCNDAATFTNIEEGETIIEPTIVENTSTSENCNDAATLTVIEEGETIIEPIIAENSSTAENCNGDATFPVIEEAKEATIEPIIAHTENVNCAATVAENLETITIDEGEEPLLEDIADPNVSSDSATPPQSISDDHNTTNASLLSSASSSSRSPAAKGAFRELTNLNQASIHALTWAAFKDNLIPGKPRLRDRSLIKKPAPPPLFTTPRPKRQYCPSRKTRKRRIITKPSESEENESEVPVCSKRIIIPKGMSVAEKLKWNFQEREFQRQFDFLRQIGMIPRWTSIVDDCFKDGKALEELGEQMRIYKQLLISSGDEESDIGPERLKALHDELIKDLEVMLEKTECMTKCITNYDLRLNNLNFFYIKKLDGTKILFKRGLYLKSLNHLEPFFEVNDELESKLFQKWLSNESFILREQI